MAKGGKSGGDSGIGRSGGDSGKGKGDSGIGKGSSDSGTSKAAGDSGIERGGKGNPSTRSSFEGNMEAAKARRMENTENASKEVPKGGLEGNVEAAKSKRMETSSQPLPKGGLEGNMNAAKVRRSGEVTPLPAEGKETKEQSKETKEMKEGEQAQLSFGDKLNAMRADPEKAAQAIDREKLIARIQRDTVFEGLSKEMKGPDADPKERAQEIARLQEEARGRYLDTTRAKGFVQEEMIRSALREDFKNVPEQTEKSVHKDGSHTFTDIVATEAVHDVKIGDTVVKAGDSLSIESKCGDERYLSEQIDHISKQLEGMNTDHRMLVVTADYERMSDQDKDRLQQVLESKQAKMMVLPFYAQDMTDTVMHMNLQETGNGSEDSERQSSKRTEFAADAAKEAKSASKAVEIAVKASETPAAVSKEAGEAAMEAAKNPETLKRMLEEGFKKQEQVVSSDSTDTKRVESMRSMIKDMFSKIGKRKESEEAAPELTEAQKLEKDRETVSKLLEENASIKTLSKSERDAVINVGISNAIENHDPNVSQERIEKMKSSIEMVDLETVKKQTGLDDDNARRILGYYSARTDKMSINVDSSRPEVSSVLATINHESLHMMSQQLDENGKPVIENRISMTGVKRSDMQDGNLGMNEGITEMYSIRDMEEINPEYKSRSYQNEVAVMREFEKVAGEELLHQAYMEGKPELLEQDYDSVMGNGMFKQFCEMMDDLHWAESNNDASGTLDSVIRENRRQLEEWTKEYLSKKEEAQKNESNN